jgi:hypothetical protein
MLIYDIESSEQTEENAEEAHSERLNSRKIEK